MNALFISVFTVIINLSYLTSTHLRIKNHVTPNEGKQLRLFITEEPAGTFCTSTLKRDEHRNRSSSICLADPPIVHLVVNWDDEGSLDASPPSNWDYVALYTGYPEKHVSRDDPIDWRWTGGQRRGSSRPSAIFDQQVGVNVSLEHTKNATRHPQHCFPYYAVFHRWNDGQQEYEEAAIDCYRIHPNWMERTWEHISGFSLNEILIPGSHDAGSAAMNDVLASPLTRTQSLGIYHQLLRGVRYLDLRIAYDPYDDDKFKIVHNIFWADTSVGSVLDDVARFLRQFPREFVILDFHHFLMGMKTKETYKELHALIVKKLGDLWVPYESRHLTLGELLGKNKRAIVAWDCTLESLCALDGFDPRPWDGISHVWPNTRSLRRMKRVIRDETIRRHKEIWVSQPIFTPVAVITNIHQKFSPVDWLKVNIVAVDFFQSNVLPDLAQEINELRWKLAVHKRN